MIRSALAASASICERRSRSQTVEFDRRSLLLSVSMMVG